MTHRLFQVTLTLLLSTLIFSCSREQQPTLQVYGSNACDHCKALKKSMDSADVVYTFYDIEVDKSKEAEMFQKLETNEIGGLISIPVVDFNGEEIILGAKWSDLSEKLY